MCKFLSLLLAALMVLGLFSFAAAEEEPFVITIVVPFYGEAEPVGTTGEKSNPVLLAIEEMLNVDLQITWAPQGDYVTKFATIMASSDQPMVLAVTSACTTNVGYLDMCADGAFWDLTDKIQENDFFTSELATPACLAVSAVNGRNYLFPSNVSSARLGVLYRQDWLDALGLEAPSTIETFKEMVRAFTEDDPDGNGAKDTIGFAYCDDGDNELTYAGFNTLACTLGAPNYWGLNADGSLMPYFFFDEYMDTLDLFKWMYDGGYMNADFAINTDKHGPLTNNIAGSMITTATNARYPGGKYDTLRELAPEAVVTPQQIMYMEDGTPVLNSTLSTGGVGGILIPTLSVQDEATVDRILEVVQALNDEGGKLITVGVEDLHYTQAADGAITISDEQRALRTADGSEEVFASMFPRRVMSLDYGQGMTPVQEITAVSLSYEPYVVSDLSIGYMDPDFQSLQTEIATTISDARVKYIVGQLDAEGFAAAREEWLALGGHSIIDNVNGNYASAN